MLFKIAATVIVVSAGMTAAFAAGEGTKSEREAMMKRIGGSIGTMASIAKGTNPYDATALKNALATIGETAKLFPDQFKPGSDTSDGAASPKIWDNAADFKTRAAKLSSDATELAMRLPADPAGVAIVLKQLSSDCSGCHQAYRLKD
jgi:cytochrome c556